MPSEIAKLTKALESKDPGKREQAAEKLRLFGSAAKPAIPLLWRLLREDADEDVKYSAARALKDLGATSSLIQALKDKNPVCREAAATTLGDFPPTKKAIPALLEALDDKVLAVAEESSSSLAKMGSGALPGLLKKLDSSKVHVRAISAQAILEFDVNNERAIEVAVRCLRSKKQEVRRIGAMALREIVGFEGLLTLNDFVRLIKDDEFFVRNIAVLGIQRIGVPRARAAFPDLLAVLDDEDWGVRALALQTLIEQFDPRIVTVLPKLIRNLHLIFEPEEIVASARLLGMLGKSARDSLPAIRKLVRQLKGSDNPHSQEVLKVLQDSITMIRGG